MLTAETKAERALATAITGSNEEAIHFRTDISYNGIKVVN
jgi:hypothetical protein